MKYSIYKIAYFDSVWWGWRTVKIYAKSWADALRTLKNEKKHIHKYFDNKEKIQLIGKESLPETTKIIYDEGMEDC